MAVDPWPPFLRRSANHLGHKAVAAVFPQVIELPGAKSILYRPDRLTFGTLSTQSILGILRGCGVNQR